MYDRLYARFPNRPSCQHREQGRYACSASRVFRVSCCHGRDLAQAAVRLEEGRSRARRRAPTGFLRVSCCHGRDLAQAAARLAEEALAREAARADAAEARARAGQAACAGGALTAAADEGAAQGLRRELDALHARVAEQRALLGSLERDVAQARASEVAACSRLCECPVGVLVGGVSGATGSAAAHIVFMLVLSASRHAPGAVCLLLDPKCLLLCCRGAISRSVPDNLMARWLITQAGVSALMALLHDHGTCCESLKTV